MNHQWTHCYRLRPYFRNVGLICTAFFAVVGLTSTLVAYFNVDGSFDQPKRAALILGLLWSAFTMLGLWLLLLYNKYRLFVNDFAIRQKGVIFDRQVEVNLIDELKWRRFPAGGSVRLSGVFGVFKIELGNLNIVEREEFVSFLRQVVPETSQIGWQEFNERFSENPSKKKQAIRVRYLLMMVFGAHAIVFGIMGAIGAGFRYFVFSGMNAAMVLYMVWSHRRKGAANVARERVDSNSVLT